MLGDAKRYEYGIHWIPWYYYITGIPPSASRAFCLSLAQEWHRGWRVIYCIQAHLLRSKTYLIAIIYFKYFISAFLQLTLIGFRYNPPNSCVTTCWLYFGHILSNIQLWILTRASHLLPLRLASHQSSHEQPISYTDCLIPRLYCRESKFWEITTCTCIDATRSILKYWNTEIYFKLFKYNNQKLTK